MKKTVIFVFLIQFLFLFALPVCADTDSMPEGYSDIEKYVPEDILGHLPENIFSEKQDEVGDALSSVTDFRFIIDFTLSCLNLEIKSSIKLFLLIVAALIISSLLSSLNSGDLSKSGGEIASFIGDLLVLSVLLTFGKDMLTVADSFFTRIDIFMTGMLPLFCTLCAMGGGLASAVAANYGISSFITLSEIALSQTANPIIGTCIGLAALGGIGNNGAGTSLLKGLKKAYVFLIGMLMTLMLAVFSAKGIIAHSADTLGSRAVKFAAGSFIPIVGANIGEILRGIGSGIAYVKNTVGVVSVMIIVLMLLPVIISISVRRLVLSLCETAAELLGAGSEGKILREFSSVYGMLLAVISMSSVLFIGAVIISVRIGNTAVI